MRIAKQLIILCMLLYNNAGFTILNLSNFEQEIQNQVEIQYSNNKSQSIIYIQQDQETQDLNKQTQTKNLIVQQVQSQDVEQSSILIGEDYQVINITNPDQITIEKQEESQVYSQQNQQIIQAQDDLNNNQFELNSQNDNVQQIIENKQDQNVDNISDSPQDFDLFNVSKQQNQNINNTEELRNQEQTVLKSTNQKEVDTFSEQQLQQSNNNENQLPFNENEDLINNQNIEKSFNEDQKKKSLDLNTSQNQERNMNDQISIPEKLKKISDEQIQDSLKVGYIIENNVETDDYLKEIEEAENNHQMQQILKQKLEQEQQYLQQLTINEQNDEDELKYLKEHEKLIYDSEQNEQQQIKKINEQINSHEEELKKIKSNYSNENNINIESEQTQFRSYDDQELIISNEVDYDEGNIEQFEQDQNNLVIEEKAETLELQNNEQFDFNWNQNQQYQEEFGLSNHITNNQNKVNDIQNYDQSIPAQPQEISIDLHLKSNDLTTQINLSKDVLIAENNNHIESTNHNQPIQSNLEENLNYNTHNVQNNQNQNHNNSHSQKMDFENKDQNMNINNSIDNNLSDKKEIQNINEIQQNKDNQILSFEDYNEQSNESDQQQIKSINSEVTLVQNINSEFANQSDKQIRRFDKEFTFQQIQYFIKRTQTKNHLRGSIKDSQQPFQFLQNQERQPYDVNNNHLYQIKEPIQRAIQILNQNNLNTMINRESLNEKEQISITYGGNNFTNKINLIEEYDNLKHIKQ